MIDPYQAAGLVRNPFVVDEALIGDDLWLDRGHSQAVAAARSFVQFVGEKGAGKTSHARRWCHQLDGTYRHIAPGRDRFRPPPVLPAVVCWDEADRIPSSLLSLCLRIVAARGGMIVAGTHRDLSGPARRAGFQVRGVTLDGITPEEVGQWADRRIAAASFNEPLARRTLGPVPTLIAGVPADMSWRDIGDKLHSWAALRVHLNQQTSIDA